MAAGARARERLERTHLFRQAGRANMPFPRCWAKRAHRCRCRGATGSVDEAARTQLSFPPPTFFFDPPTADTYSLFG